MTRAHDDHAGVHHIIAAASVADDRTRVLKHGDTFAVFDHHGDIEAGGLGEEGLYHEGTRFLSRLFLELEGGRPFFLASSARGDNDQITVALTNPDVLRDGYLETPLGTLHLVVQTFLWEATCHRMLRLRNYGREPLQLDLALHFGADFADIFEVRGAHRKLRGELLPAELGEGVVVLGYRGLDDVVRRAVLRFTPTPSMLASSQARWKLCLRPQEELTSYLSITCEHEGERARCIDFDEARVQAAAEHARYDAWSCRLESSNAQADVWLERAVSDLHMLTTELPTGPYPYAGVPWFNTPFGRDGIVTALECLWLRPEIARGVLAYLAATRATRVVPEQDAEPGKILHETRRGEMAALGEIPFGRYYGSVDATPLFVVLAGAYYQRTGDRPFVESMWPHVEAALRWIDEFGDRDRDGFVEYHRQSSAGLLHQGWKDSDDAVCHADGSPAEGPIALCEVQGYVHAAQQAGAALAALLGRPERAAELTRRAQQLRERFEQAFWCDDLATYALALDGAKRRCRVRTSNAGQCLFTGIVGAGRARRLARTLLGPDSFSGFGIRTLDAREARYNPMAYHNGSVWPHDNALVAYGLARYGMGDLAARIWTGLFEAGRWFELQRMPELFCGFAREAGEGPTLYPVACAPQAWSAASVFLLFQACLGLSIDGRRAELTFTRPCLPPALGELRIHGLELGDATVDLQIVRHADDDVSVNVLRREGDARVTVRK
jgi:glycogen debranching enzyme